MASSTEAERKLREQVEAYESVYLKHIHLSFEAARMGEEDLQLQHLKTAMAAAASHTQAEEKLDEFLGGMGITPEQLTGAVDVSSIEPDLSPASSPHFCASPTTRQQELLQAGSRDPQDSWGGASLNTSNSSTRSRQGASADVDAASPAPASQQQARDNTSSRKPDDQQQRLYEDLNGAHNTRGDATDVSALAGAVPSEMDVLLPEASKASSSCGYTPGSAFAGCFRRRRTPRLLGGVD